MAKDTAYILELLQEYGMATPEQIAYAKQQAEASEGLYDPIDILKKEKIVDGQELLSMLAQQYGMEVIDQAGGDGDTYPPGDQSCHAGSPLPGPCQSPAQTYYPAGKEQGRAEEPLSDDLRVQP